MRILHLFLMISIMSTINCSSNDHTYAVVSTMETEAHGDAPHQAVAPQSRRCRIACCLLTTALVLSAGGYGAHALLSQKPDASPLDNPPTPNPKPSPTPAPANPTCMAIKTYPFPMNQTLDPTKYYLQQFGLKILHTVGAFRPVCNSSATAEELDKEVFNGITPECDGLPAQGLEMRTEMRIRPNFPALCNEKQEVERRNKLFFDEIKEGCLQLKKRMKDSTPRCNLTTIVVNVVKPTLPPASHRHHHNHNHDGSRQNNNAKALKRGNLRAKNANNQQGKR